MLNHPIERAIPTIDGRWKFDDSKRRASGQPTAAPAGSTVSKEKYPPNEGSRRSRTPGATAMAPIPSGPSSHFWADTAYTSAPVAASSTGMAPAPWAPSTIMSAPRAWAISAMPAMGRTAPVAHRTCEMATSLVRSSIAASKAASTAS